MIATMDQKRIGVRARDVSRQRRVDLQVSRDTTIGELARELVRNRMRLTESDVEGRPITYQLRLDREGRHLYPSEVAGDVLQEDDEVVVAPNIQAGAR